MPEHKVGLNRENKGVDFSYESFNRNHFFSFDNGGPTRATSAPAYLGDDRAIDPEEMLSCQKLTFPAIASKHAYLVVSSFDTTISKLEKLRQKKSITQVNLAPKLFSPMIKNQAGKPLNKSPQGTCKLFHCKLSEL